MDTVVSLEEQLAFFEGAHDLFLKAKSSVREINYYYRICDTSVCLSFAGDALVGHITPAFSHLRISAIESPDLTVCLWDSQSTGSRMLPPPWKRDQYTYRGDIWGYNSGRIKTAFHWGEFSLNMLDLETNTGLFWVEHTGSLPFWVNASPLRTILHWWMEKNECQLIHAAAVGVKNGAVLLTGRGGIGKSTAALSCLRSGFFYLGDDFVVTRLKPEPVVYSLYNTTKLNADHTDNFPELLRFISNRDNLDHEKAVVFLHPKYNGQIVSSMPLKAILLPNLTDRLESRITEATSEDTLRAASFSTMTLLPGAGIRTYEFLNQLLANLPCFNLESGRDLVHIPVAIADLLLTVSDQSITTTFGKATGKRRVSPRAWPVISVILPVFNGKRFIREAVENILSQGYPSLEIIVVDDGSVDATRAIVEQLPIEVRYFYQDNCGPAAARNRGIINATGEYIAFLDVDDLWPKNNLRMLVKELPLNDDIDVVHGYGQMALYNDISHEYEYRGNPTESFPYYIGAALYRKSVFNKVGLFDQTLIYGEDTDWFTRAQELKINIRRLDEVTLIVRRHEENMTRGKTALELNQLRVFKKMLDRTRIHHQGPNL